MNEDHIEITVYTKSVYPKGGKHFFTVREANPYHAQRVYDELQHRFPAPAYGIECSRWTVRGEDATKQFTNKEFA